jgi:hypothetical protein
MTDSQRLYTVSLPPRSFINRWSSVGHISSRFLRVRRAYETAAVGALYRTCKMNYTGTLEDIQTFIALIKMSRVLVGDEMSVVVCNICIAMSWSPG